MSATVQIVASATRCQSVERNVQAGEFRLDVPMLQDAARSPRS